MIQDWRKNNMVERKNIRKEGQAWFDTDPLNLIGKFIEYYYNGETNLGTVKHADDDSIHINGIWIPNTSVVEIIK